MKLTAVFFVSTSVVYSVEIKVEAIKMTLASKTTKEIMDTARIRYKGNLVRWYRNGVTHPFHQGVGKQYKYQKGLVELPEIEQLKIALRQKEEGLEI
ncbi:hypothetical protein LMxysn_1240 [Listeria monocytogenes]|nr:hypothetical protein LMxysn_1240 [Listeria monocytogenes]